MEHVLRRLRPVHWGSVLPVVTEPLKNLLPARTWITTCNRLEVTKRLLRKAAVVQASPQLQLTTQTLWYVSNLKGGHAANVANACVLHASPAKVGDSGQTDETTAPVLSPIECPPRCAHRSAEMTALRTEGFRIHLSDTGMTHARLQNPQH